MNEDQKEQLTAWLQRTFDLSDQTLKQYGSFAEKMYTFFQEHGYWFGAAEAGLDPNRLDNQSEKEILIMEKQEAGRSIRHVIKWAAITVIIILYLYR